MKIWQLIISYAFVTVSPTTSQRGGGGWGAVGIHESVHNKSTPTFGNRVFKLREWEIYKYLYSFM